MQKENYKTTGASYESACSALNLDPIAELPFKGESLTPRQKCSNAHTKLMIINEAMHIGYEGDKYYEPIFIKEASGRGFAFYGTGGWITVTFVGARLQYATRAMSDFAATTHLEIYRDLIN